EPFLCPNNSLSKRSFGIAPQFTGMKGFIFLDEDSCKARAAKSLPVPLSPKINAVESLLPTVLINFRRAKTSWLEPIIEFNTDNMAALV